MKRKFPILFVLIFALQACSVVEFYDTTVDWKYGRNDVLQRTIYDGADTINYYSGGSGDTLILVHGLGANGKITWSQNIKKLAETHYLIIPDLVGFGETRSVQEKSLDGQVALLDKICAKENVSQYSIAGISYGGFVALIYANRHTTYLKKLIIIDSPGHVYDQQESIVLAQSMGEESPADIFVPQNGEEVKRLIHLAQFKDVWMPKGLAKGIYETYFSTQQAEQRAVIQSLLTNKVPAINPSLKDGKTFVIWGREDAVFDVSYADKLAADLNAKKYIIDDCGHVPSTEKRKTFNTILLNILK